MVLFEGMALTTAKPIMVAGMTTYVLDRSGFDFAQLPVVGAFWDTSKEGILNTVQCSSEFFHKKKKNI